MKRKTLLLAVWLLAVVVAAQLLISSQAQSRATKPIIRVAETDTFSRLTKVSHLRLQDGVEIERAYAQANGMEQALLENQAMPLSLASGDFDEDGMPDLISGYGGERGRMLTLHRGNVDAIYPNSPEAQQRRALGEFADSPFLLPARVFDVPVSPEFLGAGDFDADGHCDLVIAARGGEALYLMPGDGQGSFAPPTSIALPGTATALMTGEINSGDGLADIVVAVAGEAGAQALVFEHPNGALKGTPEVHPLPAEATALALARLDEDYNTDLAVAAGHELVIIHGRDRELSLAESSRAAILPASIERHALSFAVTALATGDFTGDEVNDIALLATDGTLQLFEQEESTDALPQTASGDETAAQLIVAVPKIRQTEKRGAVESSVTSEHLAVASRDSYGLIERRQPRGAIRWRESRTVTLLQTSVFSRSESAPLLVPVRTSRFASQDLVVLDQANRQLHILSQGAGISEQEAETQASATDESEDGKAYRVVSLEAEGKPIAVLPMRLNSDALHDLVILQSGQSAPAVVLSAPFAIFTVTNTNDSGPGSLRQAITDANASAGADEIRFNIPGTGPHTIKPLTQMTFVTQALTIDGTTQMGFAGKPVIELDGSQAGIEVDGLDITATGCVVRGLVINRFIRRDDPAQNVFFRGHGIDGHSNLIVEGNFIGTDVTGTKALGNQGSGLVGFGTSNVLVGGTTAPARNILSGNNFTGVSFSNLTTSNVVQGNFIGIDLTGTKVLGNVAGGASSNGTGNLIGGAAAGARNVIAGSNPASTGVGFSRSVFNNPAEHNLAQGNFIGTDLTGTKAIGSAGAGAIIGNLSDYNLIGGTTPAARNIIAGHQGANVQILDTGRQNKVQGNYIGTDVTGTKDLGNGSHGVFHGSASSQIPSAQRTTIGGAVAGAGNLISGNNGRGVVIEGNSGADANGIPFSNFVQGNFIGTDVTGKQPLGNSSDGVYLQNKANSVVIGGANSGEGNVIAFNGGRGVFVDPGLPGSSTLAGNQNTIRGNSIYSNSGLGIDLAPLGITDNDAGDADTGPNLLQNFPVLTSATTANGSTSVQGTLNSANSTNFTIEFFANPTCDTAGNGEGARFIGSTVVTTSGNVANINVTLPSAVSGTEFITATATDPSGNTSEFSACVQVSGAASPALALNHLAFDDTVGNNNGRVDLNECVRVYVTLMNEGLVAATGLSAVLSTSTPGVSISQPNSNYSDIAPGALGTNDTPFRLVTPSALACGAFIDLTVQVTTNEGMFAIPMRLRTGPLAPFSFSASGPVPIPESTPAGVELPVTVSGITAQIAKVRVKLHIKHPTNSDLDISLIGPDGTTIDLSSDNSGSSGSGSDDNYGRDCPADDQDTVFDDAGQFLISSSGFALAPFIGAYAPEQPLSTFNGKIGAAVNGTWKLRVVDDNSSINSTGTLECWMLEITSASCDDAGGVCATTPPNPQPTISINDVAVAESNSDTAMARFTVTLSAPSLIPITVQFATTDGSAIAPGDYLNTSGTLTIPAGVTSGEIAVPVVGELSLESDETFMVNLSNATNATIADGQGVATIVNDEKPEIVLASVSVDDSLANNNGKIDPNECIRLNILLRNQGTAIATGISAALSSSTPEVAVAQGNSAYSDLAANGTGNNLTPFQLSIAPTAACGVGFNLALQVTTNQGNFPLLLQLEFGSIPTDTFSANGPLAIPDNNPTGIDLPINISGVLGSIRKVIVKLHITHTSDNNLDISLIGPDGTTIILANDRGVDGDNYGTNCPADGNDTIFDDSSSTAIGAFGFSAPFVGTWKPQQPLSAFIGKSGSGVNGDWKLHVVDDTSGQTGAIQCVSLMITSVFCADGGGQCSACSLTCPPNQTVNTVAGSTQCGAMVVYPAPTVTGDCGTVTCNPPSGSFFAVGMTTVTCTATAGGSCSFTVTVTDNTPPTLNCPANLNATADAKQNCAIVNYTTPTPQDNCTGASVNCAPPSGTCFPKGTTTVTCTATDTAKNSAMCSFTVTVNDAASCTLRCPPNQNVNTGSGASQCGATVNYPSPTTTGSCGIVTCNPASGSFFAVGSTTVTCTANGGASCSFTVTVNDRTSPALACPSNVAVSTSNGQCVAVVNYSTPAASDNCSQATVVCSPPSGSTFAKGATTVTCTAQDTAGNQAVCNFTVTVNDTQPPTITCTVNVTATTPLVDMACVNVNYSAPVASDNCSSVVVSCIPPSGACFPRGVTTVNCVATDASGNSANCNFTVTVYDACLQDDTDPTATILFNTATGDYRFCCSDSTFTGRGKVKKRGQVFTLEHNPADRRVLVQLDVSQNNGTAVFQSPPGSLRCTISDRDTRTNACTCR